MIEQQTIDGKKALVAFFDKDFNLASKENAVIAKIIYPGTSIVEFVALDQPEKVKSLNG